MTTFVKALDNRTPMQYGENGHSEYGWSRNLEERIYQFYTQTTRTSIERVKELGIILHDILTEIHDQYDTDKMSKENKIDMLSILYKMIGLTRDITDGKGEYTLSYMMIYTWYSFYPMLAMFALKTFVLLEEEETNIPVHPYGSWKDMKYFANYCLQNGADRTHPLICFCADLVNNQLKKDIYNYVNCNYGEISLVAKWIPSEKSNKFGWFFKQLAVQYFPNYMASASSELQQKYAAKKCYTEYRKLCSPLNKWLDTVQIKQCANEWSTIDPAKQTSITMHKQKNAFLNKTKEGDVRIDKPDRIECSEHFKEYIDKGLRGEITIKGKRIGMNDFTRDALQLIHSQNNQKERDILNLQWTDSSKTNDNDTLGNMIAMVDVSGSMSGDPLHAAIALGIRIAEKSALGKRVLTFSAYPNWVNLDEAHTFVDMVELIENSTWGTNTNIYAAFKMICDAIETSKLPKEQAMDMILVILSDMQIDTADTKSLSSSLYNEIEFMYAELGKRLYNTPIRPPHILFWNLRCTNGFPVLSSQPNVSSVSGFNPSFLNLFCEKGVNALTECRPWSIMLEALGKDRYTVLDLELKEFFTD